MTDRLTGIQTPSNGAGNGAKAPRPQRTAHASRPLLTLAEVAADVYGVSERRFQQMRQAGTVPLPVVLGPRSLRWVRSECEQHAATLPRQQAGSERPEPAQLARARLQRLKAAGQVEA